MSEPTDEDWMMSCDCGFMEHAGFWSLSSFPVVRLEPFFSSQSLYIYSTSVLFVKPLLTSVLELLQWRSQECRNCILRVTLILPQSCALALSYDGHATTYSSSRCGRGLAYHSAPDRVLSPWPIYNSQNDKGLGLFLLKRTIRLRDLICDSWPNGKIDWRLKKIDRQTFS